MSRSRQATLLLCALRVGYGVGLMAAPARLSRTWLGGDGASPGGQVALRGLGARDALIHVGGLMAVARDTPARPWLAASVAGDCTDVAATLISRRGLPARSGPATVIVAGGSALLTAMAARAVER